MSGDAGLDYGGFYARWYKPRLSRLWWLRRRTYLLFVIRELTSVFVAWSVVFLLLMVRAVAQGIPEYERFLELSRNPWVLALNVVTLCLVVFHTVTWFIVTPQAMVVRLRGRQVPARLILLAHYAAWVVLTALVAFVVLA
ncbi:MAG: fumarate reductase subunit C [Gaiellaceae bacterium]